MAHPPTPTPPAPRPGRTPTDEPTDVLITRIRSGETRARDDLLARTLPLLRNWARGRLPHYARDLNATEDLVQTSVMRALANIDHFASEGPGSFLAYLRQILLNQVRDEVRRIGRQPDSEAIDTELADDQVASPIELAIGQEKLAAYERALAQLPARQQNLIVMRIEFGMSYPEIAAEVGGTPDAARVMVSRALIELAKLSGE
jgi:RNA polymerase sigma-70 factor (ECF subfamily)